MHNNLPNESEFATFLEKLKATIKKVPAGHLIPTNLMVTELREFARLRDDGILTNEEFEAAKRSLLAKVNSPASVGFHP